MEAGAHALRGDEADLLVAVREHAFHEIVALVELDGDDAVLAVVLELFERRLFDRAFVRRHE